MNARTGEKVTLKPVVTPKEIMNARAVVNDIYMDEKVERYIIDLIFATRNPAKYGLSDLTSLINYGASPRASINLNLASRAHAFLEQRAYVTPEDVREIAMDVLRHRVIPTYEAEAEDITPENLVERILNTVPVP